MVKTFRNVIAATALAAGFGGILTLFSAGHQDTASLVGSTIGLVPVFLLSFILYPAAVDVARKPDVAFLAALVAYYGFGIVSFTTYRGYINQYMWAGILLLAVASYLVGRQIGRRTSQLPTDAPSYRLKSWACYGILIASTGAALSIVATHGLVLLNPEARFGVSAKASYLVELSIPVVLSKFCIDMIRQQRFRWFMLGLPALALLMLLCLGYRNQPILLVLGIGLIVLMSLKDDAKVKRFRLAFAAIAPVAMFSFGLSYLIRTNNSIGRTLSWQGMIREFDVKLPEFSLPYIPLHLASREGMGVAEASMERADDMSSYIERSWFFFSDFLTMLPGYSLTSGRILGMVVNGREDSSLTPSILGGLMIGYGYIGVVVYFLLSGWLLGKLTVRFNVTRDPKTLALLTICFLYTLELMNRGIFKPMYLIAPLVTVFMFRRIEEKK